MTEIETVTVTVEEFKEDRDRYLKVKETKRLVVLRGDEEVAVLGPKLPGEERFLTSVWFEFLDEVFPMGPTILTPRVAPSKKPAKSGPLPSLLRPGQAPEG